MDKSTNSLENRRGLATATTTYFLELDLRATREEQDLAAFLGSANRNLDIDEEI